MDQYDSSSDNRKIIHKSAIDTALEESDRSALIRRIELEYSGVRVKPNAYLPVFAYDAREKVYVWRRRCATLAIGALAVGMAYGVIFGHNGLTAFAHKQEEAKTLQIQMQRLQKENVSLHEHVNRLENDPDAIEHQAREELHYTRAGEVIYALPGVNDRAQSR